VEISPNFVAFSEYMNFIKVKKVKTIVAFLINMLFEQIIRTVGQF
jgi:hypothetical protein